MLKIKTVSMSRMPVGIYTCVSHTVRMEVSKVMWKITCMPAKP